MADGIVYVDEATTKAIQAEIGKLGNDSKAIYEGLRKNVEEFRSTLEGKNKEDVLLKEKVDKLVTDVSLRQEALDKKFDEANKKANERLDAAEVAFKRSPRSNSPDNEKAIKDAIDFQISCAINKSKKEYGLQIEDMERINANPDVEKFQNYQKVFNKFLRRTGGSKDAVLEPDESKTLSVGVDPDGGYTVTPQMASTIITTIRESDPIRQLASVESISTDSIEWLVDVDQMGAGWETETGAGAVTTTADFRKKMIFAHTMYAKVRATQKLLEDSSLNIENWIANKTGDRFGRLEGAAFVTGTGVGQPRGFLTYANGTAWGQVEQVVMGAAAALTADGFIDVKYHLLEAYIERANAWLMCRSTLAAAMKLKDGSGEYIWKPSLIALDPASSILGIPVKMSATMPVIAANALSVALADWKAAYTIVDRLGITVQRDPYTQKPFVEFYTRKRVGGDIINYDAIKIGIISV